jgi:hypothetical protein
MATKMIPLVMSGIILLGSTLVFIQGPDQEQRILASTMMITMTVPELEAVPEVDEALPIPPDEYRAIARPDSYVAAEGLGTLVYKGGEPLIVTHDHWSGLDSQLGIVHIRNGHGQLLVEMQMLQFKGLIKYRDGGTMILSAPEEIATRLRSGNMLAHSLEDPNLTAGDEVSLVYRQRNGEPGVAMMQAEVESIGRKQGLPVLRLSTPEGKPIVGGDSGGGVWLKGNLAGNTWTTIMVENSLTGASRQTNTSIAALYPNSTAMQVASSGAMPPS